MLRNIFMPAGPQCRREHSGTFLQNDKVVSKTTATATTGIVSTTSAKAAFGVTLSTSLTFASAVTVTSTTKPVNDTTTTVPKSANANTGAIVGGVVGGVAGIVFLGLGIWCFWYFIIRPTNDAKHETDELDSSSVNGAKVGINELESRHINNEGQELDGRQRIEM